MGLLLHHTCNNPLTAIEEEEQNLFISPQKYTIMIHMQNETLQGKETSIVQVSYIYPRCDKIIVSSC